jgi:transposase
LETYRGLIEEINIRHNAAVLVIQKAAAGISLPKGMGAMTFEDLDREVCGWDRFKNRKQPGSYVGLVGGVSSSGNYHADLSITKAGHIRLRAILIQLAWRMVKFQSQSRLLQKWRAIFYNPRATKHARKKAIVAVARHLFVDLWRWQTGRTTPEQLGWAMTTPLSKPAAQ